MNEKSNPMPMMYKTIPAVAELNKVPGFDPLKFLRHKVSRKTNEEMLQLELPYQKLWFRLRHPQGRMKRNSLRLWRPEFIWTAVMQSLSVVTSRSTVQKKVPTMYRLPRMRH